MGILNVEIKAKSENQSKIRELIKSKNAKDKGTDHQIDTYYNVSQGRLKLRGGDIENNLIHSVLLNGIPILSVCSPLSLV